MGLISRMLCIRVTSLVIAAIYSHVGMSYAEDDAEFVHKKGIPQMSELAFENLFGDCAATVDGQDVHVTPDEDLISELQSLTDDEVSGFVASYYIINDSGSGKIFSYSSRPEEGYAMIFRRHDSGGELVRNVLNYIGVVYFMRYHDELAQIREKIENNSISDQEAQIESLKIDYQVLKKIKEFNDAFFEDWCKSKGIEYDPSERGFPTNGFDDWKETQWAIERMEMRKEDFETWRASASGPPPVDARAQERPAQPRP